MNYGIVCIGDLMLEAILPLASLPNLGITQVVDDHALEVGGPAFNVAWYLTQLGYSPILAAVHGRQEAAYIHGVLMAAGLDTGALIPASNHTDVLFAATDSHGHRSVYLRSSVSSVDVRKYGSAAVIVCIGSRHAKTRHAMIELARTRGQRSILVFNPSYSVSEYSDSELTSMAAASDVLVVNEPEDRRLRTDTGRLSAGLNITELITRGRKGVTLVLDSERVDIPAESQAERSDVIGAGDAFLAGLVAGLHDGFDIKKAARLGLAVSGEVALGRQIRKTLKGNYRGQNPPPRPE